HPAVRFVPGPIGRAVDEGRREAGDRNLEIFGANTAQQCMAAGLIDEMVVHVAPVLLGAGTRLSEDRGARDDPGAPGVKLELVDREENQALTSLRLAVIR